MQMHWIDGGGSARSLIAQTEEEYYTSRAMSRWFVLLTLLALLAHVRQSSRVSQSASAHSAAACVEACCCDTKIACDADAAGITVCSNPLRHPWSSPIPTLFRINKCLLPPRS